jgi:ComEC/Rec2-related protein
MGINRKTLFSLISTFPHLSIWARMPAFQAWIAVSFGIWLSAYLDTAIHPKTSLLYIFTAAASILSLCTGIFLRNRAAKFSAFVLLGLLTSYHNCLNDSRIMDAAEKLSGRTVTIRGKVYSNPAPYFNGYRFFFKIDSVLSENNATLRSKMLLCISPFELSHKSNIEIRGKFKLPSRNENPYGYDEYSYMKSQDLCGKLYADTVITSSESENLIDKLEILFRSVMGNVISRFSNPQHQALIRAAFLGETAYLSPELKESFRISGIYHLLSISGANTAMLVSIIYFSLWIFPIGRKPKSIIALIALWLFLLFVGFIPSLFRATVMVTCLTMALIFQKKNYSLQSLGTAGTLWLLFAPESLFLPSYQLSFSATMGIITLYPVFEKLVPKHSNPLINYLIFTTGSSLSFSLCCFLCTMPVLIYHFGTISLFGIFANLAAIPIMSIAMWCFFFCIVFNFFLPSITQILIIPTAGSFDSLIYVADAANRFSWSSISLPVPYPEIFVFFTLFLLLITLTDKKFVPVCLKWSIPGFLILLLSDLILHRMAASVEIYTFKSEKNAIIALQWPHKGVWLYLPDDTKTFREFIKTILPQWGRQIPWRHIEKVYLIENENTSGKKSISGSQVNQHEIKDLQKMIIRSKIPLYKTVTCTSGILNESDKSVLFVQYKDTRVNMELGNPDVAPKISVLEGFESVSLKPPFRIWTDGNHIKCTQLKRQ